MIDTYDGSDAAIHPGVVVLDEPLGGFTHWMAYTPYPSDELENPCIIASNDGIEWVVPNGLTNPLDPIAGDPPMVSGKLYNSDTELIHVDGTIYLVWRRYHSGTATYYVRTSTDGVAWTPREVIFDTTATGEGATSPIIIHDPTAESAERWRMWYGGGGSVRTIWTRTAPSITGPWSPRTDCPILGLEPWRGMWHFDAIKHDGILVGLFTSTQNGSTNIFGVLHLCVSLDGITWQVATGIVQAWPASPGWPYHWDSNIIYRCTGVVAPDGETLRVWYSAMPKIGYTEVPLRLIQPALDALRASA